MITSLDLWFRSEQENSSEDLIHLLDSAWINAEVNSLYLTNETI